MTSTGGYSGCWNDNFCGKKIQLFMCLNAQKITSVHVWTPPTTIYMLSVYTKPISLCSKFILLNISIACTVRLYSIALFNKKKIENHKTNRSLITDLAQVQKYTNLKHIQYICIQLEPRARVRARLTLTFRRVLD